MKGAAVIWKLLGLVALLAALHVLVSLGRGAAPGLAPRDTLIPGETDVVRLQIGSTVLTNSGTWRISEPFDGEADRSRIARMLDTLAYRRLGSAYDDRTIQKAGYKRANFGLEHPRLTLRVDYEDGRSETIDFGRTNATGRGVYVSARGTHSVAVIATNDFAVLTPPVDELRRRELFDLTPAEVTQMEIRLADGTKGQLEHGSSVNERLETYLRDLLSAKAIDFVWPTGATNEARVIDTTMLAGYGLDPDSDVTVTLRGMDGGERMISFGKNARAGTVYARVSGHDDVITVPSALRDGVLGGEEGFRDLHVFPVMRSDVRRITLVEGELTCILAIGPDGRWRLESPGAAPADTHAVEDVLTRILRLRKRDLGEGDFKVGLGRGGTGEPAAWEKELVTVPSALVLARRRLADLRSTVILKVARDEVSRLSGSGVVRYDPDQSVWIPAAAGQVDEDSVNRLLGVLELLRAKKVVTLKASPAAFAAFGLEKPSFTLAIDFLGDQDRRNVLIGNRTDGGWYCTVAGMNAVFLVDDETVRKLKANLVN